MKDDLIEDVEDIQEIRRQKQEQKRTKEEMATWEFGKGVNKGTSDQARGSHGTGMYRQNQQR